MASMAQTNLFDAADLVQAPEVAAARGRMRGMIEALRGECVPPWTDEMGVILRDGAFRRAMHSVPDDEAQSLWRKFDAEMERLYAIWAATPEQAPIVPP